MTKELQEIVEINFAEEFEKLQTAGFYPWGGKSNTDKAPFGKGWQQRGVTRPDKDTADELLASAQHLGIILPNREFNGELVKICVLDCECEEIAEALRFTLAVDAPVALAKMSVRKNDKSGGVHFYMQLESTAKMPVLTLHSDKCDLTRKGAKYKLGERHGVFEVLGGQTAKYCIVYAEGRHQESEIGLTELETLTAEELGTVESALISLAEQYPDTTKIERPERIKRAVAHTGSDREMDRLNDAIDTFVLLEEAKWGLCRLSDEDYYYYSRYGAGGAVSASVSRSTGFLTVFSTSTDFYANEAYTPFQAYALLKHGVNKAENKGDTFKRIKKQAMDTFLPEKHRNIRPPILTGDVVTEQRAAESVDIPADEFSGARELNLQDEGSVITWFLENSYGHEGLCILRYVNEDFYVWDGNKYKITPECEIRQQLMSFIEESAYKLKNGDYAWCRPKTREIDSLFKRLKYDLSAAPTDGSVWLGNPDECPVADTKTLIFCRSTVYDYASRKQVSPSPFYFNTCTLDFDPVFDEDGNLAEQPTPIYDKFMRDTFTDVHEGGVAFDAMAVLEEAMGYAMTPETDIQRIIYLFGEKRSGKGTIGRIVEKMTGRDKYTTSFFKELASTFAFGDLPGRNVLFVEEVEFSSKDSKSIESCLKSISGGDRISINQKYKSAYSARLSCKVFMVGNSSPVSRDDSDAWTSRLIPIRTRSSVYGQEDPTLFKRMEVEAPGIFVRLVNSLNTLLERGRYELIQDMIDIKNAAEERNPICAFVQTACTLAPNAKITSSKLHEAFKHWARDNAPKSEEVYINTFIGGVLNKFPAIARWKDPTGQRFLHGITLKGGLTSQTRTVNKQTTGENDA